MLLKPSVPLPEAAAAFAAACSVLGMSWTPLLPNRAAASERSPKLNADFMSIACTDLVSPSTSLVNRPNRRRALSTCALNFRPIRTPAAPAAPRPTVRYFAWPASAPNARPPTLAALENAPPIARADREASSLALPIPWIASADLVASAANFWALRRRIAMLTSS
jgi:hypothetical protein